MVNKAPREAPLSTHGGPRENIEGPPRGLRGWFIPLDSSTESLVILTRGTMSVLSSHRGFRQLAA